MCLDIYNNLYIFGSSSHGQLGLEEYNTRYKPIKHPTLSNIIDISCGGSHTFAKTLNGEIYAFGDNSGLQFGMKTENENQLAPIRVFEGNEDIWYSGICKSKAKSARK